MSTRPERRKAPKLKVTPQPHTTELIGLTEDARMVLWSEGQVQPVSKFETQFIGGRPWDRVRSLGDRNYKGHAFTDHRGNMAEGNVSLHFMCNRATESRAIDRKLVKRLTEWAHCDHDDPKRSRGRIS